MERVYVCDNGAYFIKAEFACSNCPRLIPNFIVKSKSGIKRVHVGTQVNNNFNKAGLFYQLAFQKGFLLNWNVEFDVWTHVFGEDVFDLHPNELNLIITEPPLNPAAIGQRMDEILFEEFKFNSVLRVCPSTLSAFQYLKCYNDQQYCIIVDSGYSFTHIIPYHNGRRIKEGMIRIDIGGKLLTNHLKDVISYRQLMVMDETYVINQLKEDLCYVSQNFDEDITISRCKGIENTVVKNYVLPDFLHRDRGYVDDSAENRLVGEGDQIIRMNNERFAIPEVLMRPSDIGIKQMGIPEAIVHAINLCPKAARPGLANNVVLTGGNCLFNGFQKRVAEDVRTMISDYYDVSVISPSDPLTYAWHGGAALSATPIFSSLYVTRDQYEENGEEICRKKFESCF